MVVMIAKWFSFINGYQWFKFLSKIILGNEINNYQRLMVNGGYGSKKFAII